MKFFIAVFTIYAAASVASVTASGGYGGGGSSSGGSSYGGGSSGSGGNSVSIPAPPCSNNYLFSCQPNLAPAPCSPQSAPSSGGYGSAGAYSQPIPQYMNMPLALSLNDYQAFQGLRGYYA
ncbi:vitelline membrane protein Vm26Aa-like [Teleopsis dalmanni]|uniref:vitelline membrane protein Vm26Aa-like n=1 Tax=Teleopsis dalmanni TaxID=139649 RepID=UPI0018CD4F97|nr:vitelline membrane protein Vm26Aa-like [Teleopsis dalmanni]